MTDTEAIARAADLLTACIPSAISASTGVVDTSSLTLVGTMMCALRDGEARHVLGCMMAFASRLVQLHAETHDIAPEEIVYLVRTAAKAR